MIEASGAYVRVVVVAGKDVIPTSLITTLFKKRIMVFKEVPGSSLELRVMRHVPDIVLLWHESRCLLPLGPLQELREKLPVLLLARSADTGSALNVLRAGASGYLLLESLGDELLLAAATAQRGQRYLSPRIVEPLVDLFVGQAEDEDLTRRQREILRLLAQGETVKEVAHEMRLSVKTVNAHRLNIRRKLGIGNMAELIFYALRHGLIDVPVVHERQLGSGQYAPSNAPAVAMGAAVEVAAAHVSPRNTAY